MTLPNRFQFKGCRSLVIITLLLTAAGCFKGEPRVTGSGVFEATTVSVSPEIAGRIETIPLDDGDTVAAGDLLCRLDTTLLEREKASQAAGFAEIDAAEARATADVTRAVAVLEGARREYDRAKTLLERGSIPRQRYDELETAYTVARRSLAAARAVLETFPARRGRLEAVIAVLEHKISMGTITSPLGGTVLETFAEPGEYAAPGRALLEIADMDAMWIRIYVPEPALPRVAVGNRAKIYLDGDAGEPVMGTVSWISDRAEFTPKNVQTRDARADLVYAVKVNVDRRDSRLKIGMPADVCLEGFQEYERHPYSESR